MSQLEKATASEKPSTTNINVGISQTVCGQYHSWKLEIRTWLLKLQQLTGYPYVVFTK